MGWPEASAIFAQGNAAFYLDADSQAYTFLDPASSAVVDTVEARNLLDTRYSGSVQVDNAAGAYYEPADARSLFAGLRWSR
jgi:hypothetical protein